MRLKKLPLMVLLPHFSGCSFRSFHSANALKSLGCGPVNVIALLQPVPQNTQPVDVRNESGTLTQPHSHDHTSTSIQNQRIPTMSCRFVVTWSSTELAQKRC